MNTLPDKLHGAGIGIRGLATIIDTVAIVTGYFIYMGLFSLVATQRGRMTGIPVGIFLVLVALYFFFFEWKFGATIGKRILGLSVVMEDGTPVTRNAAAIRTLMRVIDGQLIYLVAAIAVLASPGRQRLGDMVAKTFVISK
jgi:uncharacterized RDD family membrane protein YckC